MDSALFYAKTADPVQTIRALTVKNKKPESIYFPVFLCTFSLIQIELFGQDRLDSNIRQHHLDDTKHRQ